MEYRVVLDNDRAIWGGLPIASAPPLSDRPRGYIRHDHAGEGGAAATRAIRAALADAAPGAALLPPVFLAAGDDGGAAGEGEGEAAVGAACTPGTPELFVGYYRGVSGNLGGFREDEAVDFSDPGYREGFIHLQGRWRVGADAAHFAGPGPGYLRVAYRGDAANAVLAPDARSRPIVIRVAQTGTATPPGVATTAAGGARIAVDAPRPLPAAGRR